MANAELIKKLLPEDLWNVAMNFNIPDSFLENETDLVVLILKSRSLAKNEEKQSWFDLIPMMNHEQIEKLRDILTREKEKLAEIEQKYAQKKQEIKAKYEEKFNAVSYNKKISSIKEKEESVREKEVEEADSLLENL